MGVVKISQSFKTKVTPARMFRALILDSHNLCPKLMFSSIKSIDLVEGNGEAGSIKQMNFTEGKTKLIASVLFLLLENQFGLMVFLFSENCFWKQKQSSLQFFESVVDPNFNHEVVFGRDLFYD